jgi:hypothetical protein
MAFTDDFTGAENTNLGSRSGWTLIDGVATSAQINATNELKGSADQSSFKCTDQGSANHYTQAVWRTTNTSAASFVVVRLTNSNGFIGVRNNSNTWQLYKRVSGTFTSLGSYASAPSGSNVVYIEGNSNSITVKVDGTTRIGPITETFNNTVTVQGLVPRSLALNPWLDNFEAGMLGAGGALIDLTSATLTKTTQVLQNKLQATLSTPAIQYVAQAIQNSLLITTTTALFSKVAQSIQNKIALVLSTPTFTFTPLSISLGTILALGVGLLTFTSWSIDVTGAIATVLRLLALMGVGS